MSKWIKKDAFKQFREEKKHEEQERRENNAYRDLSLLWPTPKPGGTDTPKVYEGRLLPDPTGEFYMRYYYHFFKSSDDEKWEYGVCAKTFDWKAYCPLCAANHLLYKQGSKSEAYAYKRKERFITNWHVLKDPRDEERKKSLLNTTLLYEFPSKVEQKVKKEIIDRENGYGLDIFDPGKNGRDFILNVLSTKRDNNGKSWPDYSTSEFSRKQSALGTDKEIEAIMKNTKDLKAYIKSQAFTTDKLIEILKDQGIYDLVEEELHNNGLI